nr:immunoglobulin light chain junction region [Macaca mulatta]
EYYCLIWHDNAGLF